MDYCCRCCHPVASSSTLHGWAGQTRPVQSQYLCNFGSLSSACLSAPCWANTRWLTYTSTYHTSFPSEHAPSFHCPSRGRCFVFHQQRWPPLSQLASDCCDERCAGACGRRTDVAH